MFHTLNTDMQQYYFKNDLFYVVIYKRKTIQCYLQQLYNHKSTAVWKFKITVNLGENWLILKRNTT